MHSEAMKTCEQQFKTEIFAESGFQRQTQFQDFQLFQLSVIQAQEMIQLIWETRL